MTGYTVGAVLFFVGFLIVIWGLHKLEVKMGIDRRTARRERADYLRDLRNRNE